MHKTNRYNKFLSLRKAYPLFVYQSYTVSRTNTSWHFTFHFELKGEKNYVFRPEMEIPFRDFYGKESLPESVMENLAFQIGMVELVSYWKAACPPKVEVLAGKLDEEQIAWWKKLYFHGLGEFFYLNGIETDRDGFMEIVSTGEAKPVAEVVLSPDRVLVPIGGGKDSVVTLELLKKSDFQVVPFLLNPREASVRTVEIAGYDMERSVVVYRTLDPGLLRMNAEGFLNGHTPFSALLAFVSALTALMSGTRFIALSNESSANQSTVPGSKINHQYSKSFEFEQDFGWYLSHYVHPQLHYFSFLRPLNELQIAALFSRFPRHHFSFRSCNVGSKTDSWCGNCPKCLFTYVILSPFLEQEKLEKIFGKNLLQDAHLQPLMDELDGKATVKPFECVGTPDEVNAALLQAVKTDRVGERAALVQAALRGGTDAGKAAFDDLLSEMNTEHHLPDKFLSVIRKALDDVAL